MKTFAYVLYSKMWACFKSLRLEKGLRDLASNLKHYRGFAQNSIPQEATLFHHDRRKFFRLVGLASTSQFFFWVYLANFQYTTRPQLLKEKQKNLDLSRSEGTLWKIATFVESSPVLVSVLGVSMGMFLSITGWVYCLRNVNHIALLRGNNLVRLVTHTPLGGTRSLMVSVESISSMGSRVDNKSQIAVKLKGHKFFFLIDKEGTFVQPSLFDKIIGVRRF